MSENNAEIQVNPLMHLVAPITAFAATALVRKALGSGYRAVTGHDAPEVHDPNARLRTVLLWTLITTATAAVVEVAIYRATNEIGARTK
mgnify:CR=1 FL=1